MKPDEPYEAWKRDRAEAAVPDDFADRVMDAIKSSPGWRKRTILALLTGAAGAAFLLRVAAVLSLLVAR